MYGTGLPVSVQIEHTVETAPNDQKPIFSKYIIHFLKNKFLYDFFTMHVVLGEPYTFGKLKTNYFFNLL